MDTPLPTLSPRAARARLLNRHEIAIVDVREEDPFAQVHPLFAAQMSIGRLELDAPWRLPRRDVCIAVYDDGEGLADLAAYRLRALGWTDVHLLEGGLAGWRAAGFELFRDVNSASKAFGELVEHERHTPSLPPEQVKALLDSSADMVVLDVRRFDEYQTMCIPGGVSVPGAELLLRVRDLAPNPATRVIVNCAGRTRSVIGAQSLINAGIPNPVAALRNGTIGWTLAGLSLAHGEQRRFDPASSAGRAAAQLAAQSLADRAGATRLDRLGLARWRSDATRTLYCWDVRTPEEYIAGHLPGFGSAPGGQLVQETDVFAAVRGARIVVADGGPASDGARAPMTAHWLAQMGWEVGWLADTTPSDCGETGGWHASSARWPEVPLLTARELAARLDSQTGRAMQVIDLGPSARHVQAHVPGAAWALRSHLKDAVHALPPRDAIVLYCPDGALSRFAAADVAPLRKSPVAVLDGGWAAWAAAGLPVASGAQRLLSPSNDRYRRPYEGTDAPREAMQAYLDWEFGLVEQLRRDGTHGFRVLPASGTLASTP